VLFFGRSHISKESAFQVEEATNENAPLISRGVYTCDRKLTTSRWMKHFKTHQSEDRAAKFLQVGRSKANDATPDHCSYSVTDPHQTCDVAPCAAVLQLKFDSCNNLLSSIHTLLVNILRYVRLYIKRKYYYVILINQHFPLLTVW